jgi:hypothetical protein
LIHVFHVMYYPICFRVILQIINWMEIHKKIIIITMASWTYTWWTKTFCLMNMNHQMFQVKFEYSNCIHLLVMIIVHCFNFLWGTSCLCIWQEFFKTHQHIISSQKHSSFTKSYINICIIFKIRIVCSYLCEIQMPIAPHPLLVSRLLLLPFMMA